MLFVFFGMANPGLMGASGFIDQFMVIVTSFQKHPYLTLMAASTLIIGTVYSLWLAAKRVMYGEAANVHVAIQASLIRKLHGIYFGAMVMRGKIRASIFLACVFIPFESASADTLTLTPQDEYANLLRESSEVEPLGLEALGDKTNQMDGSTTFYVTDIDLPTNSGMRVSLSRYLEVSSRNSGTEYPAVSRSQFGYYWELDVPFMSATFTNARGWVASSGTTNGSVERCTRTMTPPTVNGIGRYSAYQLDPEYYWDGNSIHIPGHGQELMLEQSRLKEGTSDSYETVKQTKSMWRITCLSNLKYGEGEGFLVTLPNGTKYYFDWMALRTAPSLMTGYGTQYPGETILPRDRVLIYATKIEDRYGNYVEYNYEMAGGGSRNVKLTKIQSNDGVVININYDSQNRISEAVANGAKWIYQYSENADAKQPDLASVTLPDQSTWEYQYSNIRLTSYLQFEVLWKGCNVNIGSKSSNYEPASKEKGSITIKHPSGLTGNFMFRTLIHGSNQTPGECEMKPIYSGAVPGGSPLIETVKGVLSAYHVPSLYSKQLSGPGMDQVVINYKYEPSWSFSWSGECPSSGTCNKTSRTTVEMPDNEVRTYTFGNDYNTNFGQLLEETVSSGSLLRKISYSYLTSAEGQPFPDNAGNSRHPRINKFNFKYRPIKSKQIVQDSVSFLWRADSYDSYVRPTQITRSRDP